MRWRRQGERDAAPQPARAAAETGHPLEPAVRDRMESRLGHDFGSVRIHHRPEEARALHARAFTVGEDVAFAPGQYAPGTAQGERLLAHELGHVVDHRHGAPPGAYRAPEGEQIPAGPERPLPVPRSLRPALEVPPLSLWAGTLHSFAFNGSELTSDHRKQVPDIADRLVSLMTNIPGGRITVTGHTDLVGGEQVNLDLGRKRAVAVAAALAEAGIPLSTIEISSEGKAAPEVETEGREPRNRRVEVRYAGAPIPPEGPQLQRGPPEPPPTFTFTPIQPIFPVGPAPGAPPFFTTPGRTPSFQTPGPQPFDPTRPDPEPRPGSLGDIAKAVAAIPDVKKLIADAEAHVLKDLGSLTTTDKVVLGSVSGAIALGAIAGIASDPSASRTVLDFIDGKEIPIPGLRGFAIVPHTKGGAIGGGVTFDIVKIFGGGKK